MHSRIKNYIKKVKVRRQIRRHDNIAILYHHVGQSVGFISKFHSVTQNKFISQINFFKKYWEFVDEDTFFEKVTNNEKGYAVLTFDDGYKDTFLNTLPYLEENKIPYSYFINSCSIINKWMWRDLLRWIIDNDHLEKLLEITTWEIDKDKLLQNTKNPDIFPSKKVVKILEVLIKKHPSILDSFKKLDLYIKEDDIKKFNSFTYGKVGNHTSNHYVLSTLSKNNIEEEITSNTSFINMLVNEHKIANSFSMPFGGESTFNDTVISTLIDNDFKYLFISGSSSYFKKQSTFCFKNGLPTIERVLPKEYF
jgi:peptidoglycan/xylan/chitin deacetylase (PgdA/CDA1 family)